MKLQLQSLTFIMLFTAITCYSAPGAVKIYNETETQIDYYVDEKGQGPAFTHWEGKLKPQEQSKKIYANAANCLNRAIISTNFDKSGGKDEIKVPLDCGFNNVTITEKCVKKADGSFQCRLEYHYGLPKRLQKTPKLPEIPTEKVKTPKLPEIPTEKVD